MSITKDPVFINLKQLTVRYKLGDLTVNKTFKARQIARTLYALIKSGESGITALQMSSWAFRLSAYVHNLRRDYHLAILTQPEEHAEGWHARYVLRTAVEIIEVKVQ